MDQQTALAMQMLQSLKQAPAWRKLSPAERNAASSVTRQLAAVVCGAPRPLAWSAIADAIKSFLPVDPAASPASASWTVGGAWIDHDGSREPNEDGTRVIDVKMRNGRVLFARQAGVFSWTHTGSDMDIVAYRYV